MTPKETQWRFAPPTLVAVSVVLGTGLAWTTTGSRPALFVCVATIAIAAIDVAWARAANRGTRVTVIANPAEVYVGDPVGIELDFAGPPQTTEVLLVTLSPNAFRTAVHVPVRRRIQGLATDRALHTELVLEVFSFGLAGLMSSRATYVLPLPRPLAIGPRPLAADQPFPDLFRNWGDGEPRPSHAGDVVRGVRPYVPGDPMHRIHWRATARTGDLVVKEVDETGAQRLTIALDLGGGGIGGEQAARRAAWYAAEGRQRGYAVTLVTVERRRTVRGPITSPSDVIRRLAAATATGPPQLTAEDQGATVLLVTFNGDAWR